MAVTIRLRREGAKNRPYYRVVVADSRSPRDGKFIEMIGNYDPKKAGENTNLDLARAEYWVSKGAQPSDTVRSIIRKTRRAQAAAAK
jgi:small subunit ribosomal protein S16